MPTTISGDTGVDQIQSGATSSNLPVFQCRAWVNFDGTRDSTGAASTANTNRFIRASGNVASVLRNGVGDYTVNFTTAMPDVNYSVSGTTGAAVANNNVFVAGATAAPTASAYRFNARSTANTSVDMEYVNVAIFR